MIIILILLGLTLLFAADIAACFTCGWFVDNKAWTSKIIKEKNNKETVILSYNNDILLIGKLPLISPINTILSKYYIFGIGRVWRWSKVHKIIDKTFKEYVPKPLDYEENNIQ